MPEESFTYTNRVGRRFYLCAVVSRVGADRLVMASTPTGRPLAAIPPGWEVAESVNGTVSLRRIGSVRVTVDEIEQVRTALSTDARWRSYRVDARGKEIVVHEPQGAHDAKTMAWSAAEMGCAPGTLRRVLERLPRRYSPVLRFVLTDPKTRTFTAHRWCWRGSVDGWLGLAGWSPLGDLLNKYLPHLGQESFYELAGYRIKGIRP